MLKAGDRVQLKVPYPLPNNNPDTLGTVVKQSEEDKGCFLVRWPNGRQWYYSEYLLEKVDAS